MRSEVPLVLVAGLAGCGLINTGHYTAAPEAGATPVDGPIALYVVSSGPFRDTRDEGRKNFKVKLSEIELDTALAPEPQLAVHSAAIGDALASAWDELFDLHLELMEAPHAGSVVVSDLVSDAASKGYRHALVVGYEPFDRWTDIDSTSRRAFDDRVVVNVAVYRGYLFVPSAGLFDTEKQVRTWTFERFGWVQTARLPNLFAPRSKFETHVLTRSEIGSENAEEAAANAARLLTPGGGLFMADFVPPLGAGSP